MNSIVKGNICIITPEEKQVDITNATTFGEQFSHLLEGNFHFILNLENIGFMDSSGLGKIIEGIRIVKNSGNKLVICQIQDAVKVLFSMVNISQITILADSIDDAEKRLSRQ